jgi:hypothetical protein
VVVVVVVVACVLWGGACVWGEKRRQR